MKIKDILEKYKRYQAIYEKEYEETTCKSFKYYLEGRIYTYKEIIKDMEMIGNK